MCTVQLILVGFGKMQIERLALVDVRATVSGHLDYRLLRYLPDSLVQFLYAVWNAFNSLHIEHNNMSSPF